MAVKNQSINDSNTHSAILSSHNKTTSAESSVERFEAANRQLKKKKQKHTVLILVLFSIALVISIRVGEFSLTNLIEGMPGLFNYVKDTTPEIRLDSIGSDVKQWYWGFTKWIRLLIDTIFLAFMGTLIGTIAAFALCFPGSRNLVKSYLIYFICRRTMEIARAVPELVYAMIFVFSFGLGPLPGVLAIAIHTAGALGKLFSEVNENIDMNLPEGLLASGANWFQTMRYAVVPQVLPNFLSYILLRFEINVRAASIIGFVGAGGIGQELMFVIRQFVYTDISAIVLMIICTVSIIDISCEKIRHAIIGKEVLA
jgi:phosphonate transport system permease protein